MTEPEKEEELRKAEDSVFQGPCRRGQAAMPQAVVMPQFAYRKGQLAMASRSVEDLFINVASRSRASSDRAAARWGLFYLGLLDIM